MIQRTVFHNIIFRDLNDCLKQRDRLYRLDWRDKTGLVRPGDCEALSVGMSLLKPAGQGEILRAAEKDESYLSSLQQRVTSLCLELFGPEVWLRHSWLCEPLARLLYLSLTTLSDLQTLGEEYTGLVQLNRQGRLPSKYRRFLMILLHTFGPHLLKYLIKNAEKIVRKNQNIREDAKKTLLTTISYGEIVSEYLSRINVCLFYFHGTFYQLAKRLTGIRYVNFSEAEVGAEAEDQTRTSFRLMGSVASAQLVLTLLYGVYKARRLFQTDRTPAPVAPGVSEVTSPSQGDSSGGSYVRPGERCSLCLDRLGSMGVTTATPCGHLYCWSCLLDSLARQPDCPLCRQVVQPSRIIPCRNYL